MAVVKLGKPVKSNLGGPNGAMAYIINPIKTDGGRLVSSNYERTRTDYDALAEGMLDDNRRSPKGIRKDSRLAYHIKLSFSPDDPVTPERVHELGVEFARRITGGEYKFAVATHTDRHHLHDHIMVCAASRYGKHLKAELPKDIIDQWRAVSDEICRREGLSVVFNPVVEEQTRKMRGGTTAAGDAGTSPARDPKYVDEAPVRSANEPETKARKASGGEPLERRYGMSMEEIYAAAKGLGVKDRLRMLIDLTSSTAENFEDWKDILDIRGVDVTVRGQHLTYTLKDTGFKIRDAKLGQAYDMTNIMAGLQSTPVIPITFNRRLVAKQTRKTITVWLPGTHRKKKITFDAKRLVDDGGSTLRAFLPRDRDQIILDPSNRYAGKTPTPGLYQWFGEPTSRLEPLTSPERLPLRYGVSPAQQRYYQAQARLDLIADVENRQQNNRQQTAVDFWAALYINRVILCRQQLRNQVNQFKLCSEQFFQLLKLVAIAVEDVAQLCPDALGKFHFTLAQRVNHWQQHNCRTEQTCNGRIAHSADGLEIVICLSALAVCTEEQIENKVDHDKDGNHEANIEMSYKHECQRNGVVDFSAIINQTFQSSDNQWQEYQTIQPHRVNQLNHSVCHHCIHAGEQQSVRSTDFSPLLEIIAECHTRCTKFAELHNQQAGKNPFFRQQHNNQRKRAGKIIANDTHKVAGEVSRPVIEDAAISPKSVPHEKKSVFL